MDKNIDIKIFSLLNEIARSHGISAVEWASAAEIRIPSISELRNLVTHAKVAPTLKTGRACTFEKLNQLAIGLRKLVGDKLVTQRLLEYAEKEVNIDKKIVLLELAINSSSKWKKERAIDGMIKLLRYENKVLDK